MRDETSDTNKYNMEYNGRGYIEKGGRGVSRENGGQYFKWEGQGRPPEKVTSEQRLERSTFTKGVCIVCNRENLEPSQVFINKGMAK